MLFSKDKIGTTKQNTKDNKKRFNNAVDIFQTLTKYYDQMEAKDKKTIEDITASLENMQNIVDTLKSKNKKPFSNIGGGK